MPKFQCDPHIEVLGQQVIAFFNNARSEEIRPVLAKYGLASINPDEWYPVQSLLDVLSDLAKQADWSANFVSIGMAMADAADLPPESRGAPIEDFLMRINAEYQAWHRGGDTGIIEVQKLADGHFQLVNEIKTAYPDDMVYGLVYGYVRRLLPQGTPFRVRYNESGGPRRDYGGDFTVIDIAWSQTEKDLTPHWSREVSSARMRGATVPG